MTRDDTASTFEETDSESEEEEEEEGEEEEEENIGYKVPETITDVINNLKRAHGGNKCKYDEI